MSANFSFLPSFKGARQLRGSAITLFAFGYSQAIRLLTTLILTRLLAPEMFGLMAVVLSVQVTLGLFSDIGLRTVVVQSARGDQPAFLHTAFSLEILRSLLVWVVCVILSLVIYVVDQVGVLPPHTTLSDPLLPAVLAVTSFSTVLYGFRSTKMLTALRQIRLEKLAAIEITAHTSSIAFTIVLSHSYPSVWPLVFGAMLSSLITVVLSHVWISRFPDRLGWDRAAIREFYISGRWILASSGIQAFVVNADRFILAALASPTFLGLYSLAINFVLLVEIACGKLMSDVAYPALCEVAREKNGQFARILRRTRFQIDSFCLLASGGFFASGQAIIDSLYDPRYACAGPTLQVLALGLFFYRYLLFPFAYMALGQPQLMGVVNAVRLVGLIAITWTAWWFAGLDGVIYGIALSTLPAAAAILWINRRFALNDLKFELAVLPMWGIGYLLGSTAAMAKRFIFG